MAGWNYNSKTNNFSQGNYNYDPTTGKTTSNGQADGPDPSLGYTQDSSGNWTKQDPGSSNDGGNYTYTDTWQNPAPAAPTATEQLQAQQTGAANDFQAGLPGMKANMASMLTQNANQSLQSTDNDIKNNNSARGMSYGGVNAGQQAGAAASAQSGLASSIATGDQGLDQAANSMDAQAIATQTGIQAANQAAQNQAYSRALASQNSNNSLVGGLIGTAANIGMMAAFAP
jgi:hypothetical protein